MNRHYQVGRMLISVHDPQAMQAWTSLGTAVCTFLTLIAVAFYTYFTKKTYDESHRPVLILFEVVQDGAKRLAVFKNTGQGVALDIRREGVKGTPQKADSNVLAPGQKMLLDVSHTSTDKVFDVRYVSLDKKKFATISACQEDGRVLNRYFPDAKAVSNDVFEEWRKRLDDRVTLGDVGGMLRDVLDKEPM